jgi:hypothetical protein
MSEKARLQTNICDTRTLRTGRYQEATSHSVPTGNSTIAFYWLK